MDSEEVREGAQHNGSGLSDVAAFDRLQTAQAFCL
jgi:hypothetical protein